MIEDRVWLLLEGEGRATTICIALDEEGTMNEREREAGSYGCRPVVFLRHNSATATQIIIGLHLQKSQIREQEEGRGGEHIGPLVTALTALESC